MPDISGDLRFGHREAPLLENDRRITLTTTSAFRLSVVRRRTLHF
jgi:hypothetical protein